MKGPRRDVKVQPRGLARGRRRGRGVGAGGGGRGGEGGGVRVGGGVVLSCV